MKFKIILKYPVPFLIKNNVAILSAKSVLFFQPASIVSFNAKIAAEISAKIIGIGKIVTPAALLPKHQPSTVVVASEKNSMLSFS